MRSSYAFKLSKIPNQYTNNHLPTLRNGYVDWADLTEERVKAAVADDRRISVLTLLCVTVEEHVVSEQLSREDSGLLGAVEACFRVEFDAVHVRIGEYFPDQSAERRRLFLNDDSQITFSMSGIKAGNKELEVAANFTPAAEEARSLDLTEGLWVFRCG